VALYTEKMPGRGEDASPTVLRSADGSWMIAVFDGLGGSGAHRVPLTDGTFRTHAAVASRLVRRQTELWRIELAGEGGPSPADLGRRLRRYLATVVRGTALASGVRTRLRRDLPSTMALVSASASARTAMWAGDSRAYVLTPDHGLQQLTADDVEEPDVLEQLRTGPPMRNVVDASGGFEIGANEVVDPPHPAIYLAATDGLSSYVQTPGEVELLLVATLAAATSTEEWADALVGRLTDAPDDVTLAAVIEGWPDYAAVRRAFADRLAWLQEHQVVPVDGDDGSRRAAAEAAWQVYRDGYVARLPLSAGAG
jgi:hypothetical protein